MENSALNQNDDISLKDLILKLIQWYKYLLSKWLIILTAGIIGGILGYTYAYFKKPVYTAETTFVLEEGEKGGGLGAYAGIASMVGIDLGAGGDGVFQGDNILELYKSRRMIQQTLLSKDTFEAKPSLLIERFISYNKLKDKWHKNPRLVNLNFDLPKEKYILLHDSIIGTLVEEINKKYLEVSKPDKKLSIIQVAFKSEDEQFAKSFTENIVKTVNEFYVQTKTKKSTENLAILEHQADSVRRILNYSISGVAAAVDANPNTNPAFQRLRVPSQRRQVDVQANSAIYQEIVKNLELSKVTLRKEKPLIQVIDLPVLPLKKTTFGKTKFFLIGAIISIIIALLILIIKKSVQSLFKH